MTARTSTKKILGFCQFLLVAGSETTTLMIGNVLHRLMENPTQFKLPKSNLNLIPNATKKVSDLMHQCMAYSEQTQKRPPFTEYSTC